MATPDLKGYLVVKVLEVTGKSKEDEPVWDSSLKDAFIKIEVRSKAGGPRTVKKQTTIQPIVDNMITFEEQLALEILEGADELRIMLCRQRRTDGRTGTSVIAACGIFVHDILEAVPIDKFFDLFKPGLGTEGGFVRVSMSFLTPEEVQGNSGLLGQEAGKAVVAAGKTQKSAGGGSPLVKVLLLGALVAAAAFGYVALQGKKEEKEDDKGKGGKPAAAGKDSKAKK